MDTPLNDGWRRLPHTVVAMHESCTVIPLESDWIRFADEIGQDGGVIGVYDVAHFQDVSVIPADHTVRREEPSADARWLWYRFVCHLLGKQDATLVPYGLTIHWDGGFDVDTFSAGGEIAGIRLSICGWPDAI